VVEAHTILSAAWTPGDELTETLKPRRGRIMDKYAAEIDAMYDQAASFTDPARNPFTASRDAR
jgi:long-subunit acyl-CoA synthetase (AMP-forming)